MSNGNGVAATLGNAAGTVADKAKDVGSTVAKRASKAVEQVKQAARQVGLEFA